MLAAFAAAHGRRVATNLPYHHWEDWRFFRHNKAYIHSPIDCFTQPSAWPGLFRPLSTNCYYLAGRTLFANRVEVYHAVNAVVFVANALLLFSISRTLLRAPWSFVPPVLFSSRLAHFQVLLYTSEFQVLLSTFLCLAALRVEIADRRSDVAFRRTPRRGPLLAALGLFVLALLSKETAIVLPAITTSFALVYERRPRWAREAAWWAVAVLWALFFALVFKRAHPEPTGFEYDVSWAVLPRLLGYFLVFWNPLVHPIDDPELVGRVARLLAHPLASLGASLLCVAGGGLLLHARRAKTAPSEARALAFGLLWFLVATTPFLLLDDRLFMRYSYFPHAGLSLAVAGAVAWIVGGIRRTMARSRQVQSRTRRRLQVQSRTRRRLQVRAQHAAPDAGQG